MACVHHWKITSPNGSTVLGVCKHCGEERAFPTSSEADVWYGDEAKARRLQAGPAGQHPAEAIRVVWR